MVNKDNIVPKLESMTIECEEIESIITAIEDGFSGGYGKFDTYMPAFEAVRKKAKQLSFDLACAAEDIGDAIKKETKASEGV